LLLGRISFLLTIILCSCVPGWAQTRDSIATLASDSVTVTAVREPNISAIDSRSAIVATTSELARRAGTLLASHALSTLSSSLSVRRYAPFGSAFVSFRGLPAEYTTFYRDGIRIPSEQNSLVDVGQVGLQGIERIEVIPSAEAIVLGGDAIGAAVNLVNRDYDTTRAGLTSELRSYGGSELISDIVTDAQFHITPAENISIVGGFSDAHSTGKYPFVQSEEFPVHRDTVISRANSDATLVSEFANAAWILGKSDIIRVRANHFSMDRGLPGAPSVFGFGASQVHTRELDDQTFTSVQSVHRGENSQWATALSYQSQYELYAHPETRTFDTARSHMFGAALKWGGTAYNTDLFAGGDYAYHELNGSTNALPNGSSTVNRARVSGYVAASRAIERFNVSGAFRVESISGVRQVNLLPQATLTAPLWQNGFVHIAFGRAYHPPTFNELYWSSEGGIPNPNLRPERAESWSAMLQSPITVGSFIADGGVTLFSTRVIDEILWLTSGTNTSTPYNLGPIVTRGAELHGTASTHLLGFSIAADESYTLLNARVHDQAFDGNEVPYSSPTASLFVVSIARAGYGLLGATVRYSGHKYTDPGNNPEGALPAETIFNMSYDAPAIALSTAKLLLRVTVTNLQNIQHAEFPGYPLPGRAVTLTSTINY
jgi:outer membrane cobalamin receptor